MDEVSYSPRHKTASMGMSQAVWVTERASAGAHETIKCTAHRFPLTVKNYCNDQEEGDSNKYPCVRVYATLAPAVEIRRAEGERESFSYIIRACLAAMSEAKTHPPFILRASSSQHVAGEAAEREWENDERPIV